MSDAPNPSQGDVKGPQDSVERWLAEYDERVRKQPRDRTDVPEPQFVKLFMEGVTRLEAVIRDLTETKPTAPRGGPAGEG